MLFYQQNQTHYKSIQNRLRFIFKKLAKNLSANKKNMMLVAVKVCNQMWKSFLLVASQALSQLQMSHEAALLKDSFLVSIRSIHST